MWLLLNIHEDFVAEGCKIRDIHLTESDAVDHGNCAIRILKVPNTFYTSKAVASCTTSSLIFNFLHKYEI